MITTLSDVDEPGYILARVPADTPRPSVLTDSNVGSHPHKAPDDPDLMGFWSVQVCPAEPVNLVESVC